MIDVQQQRIFSWYPVTTYWNPTHLSSLTGTNQPWLLEADPSVEHEPEVINTAVSPVSGTGVFRMDVLVRAVGDGEVPVAGGLHVGDHLPPVPREEPAGEVGLHAHHADVHLV